MFVAFLGREVPTWVVATPRLKHRGFQKVFGRNGPCAVRVFTQSVPPSLNIETYMICHRSKTGNRYSKMESGVEGGIHIYAKVSFCNRSGVRLKCCETRCEGCRGFCCHMRRCGTNIVGVKPHNSSQVVPESRAWRHHTEDQTRQVVQRDPVKNRTIRVGTPHSRLSRVDVSRQRCRHVFPLFSTVACVPQSLYVFLSNIEQFVF